MGSHPLAGRLARLALVVLALAGAPSATAAVSSTPDRTFVVEGSVSAVARTADKIYLGGSFTQVGPRTGPWAAISASSGQVDASMPQVAGGDGGVFATVSDGSGGFFVGGDFTHVGGVARNNLAHIRSNGTVDPNWNPNASDAVNALALSGSTVYIGGAFNGANSINGNLTRNRLAAVDATTGTATGWNPDSSGDVTALAVSGSTVYIGGRFSGANSINGNLTRNRLAAVDAMDGVATGWNPDANELVFTLAVSGSTVYIGGSFEGANSINGSVTRNRVAAVDATTGNATGWDPNASDLVNAFAVSGDTVYIGGDFNGANSINGNLTRNRLAAVDATTGTATGWDPNANGGVLALAVSGSTVYVGGAFNGANSINGTLTRNRLAAVDATTGTATAWNPNAAGGVNEVVPDGGGGVIAVGSFTTIGFDPQKGIAAFSQAPVSTAAPALGGTPRVGQALSCSQGGWSGTLPQSYARQWLRDGAPIAGATAAGYTVTGADAGHALSCRVTARNLGGSATATSAALNVPAASGGGGGGAGGGGPTAPAKASFAGSRSSIRVGRNRRFVFRFRGTPRLPGTASFASVNRVEVGRRQRITLARKGFTVPRSGRVALRIRLSKKRFRILRRNRSIRVRVTVTLKNSAGLTSRATKRITLRAPKPKRRR